MNSTKRVLALVAGVIGLVQFRPLSYLRGDFPTNPAESLGSYIGRKLFTAAAISLVAYGLGFFSRSKKPTRSDSADS